MPGEPQGWLDLDRYLAAQERILENASTFFVDDPTAVRPEFLFEGTLRLHGDLLCRGGLLLHVDKYFDIGEGNRIRGYRHRYHGQFAKPPLRQIFRYDNDHTCEREGHPDAFPKHIFSDRTWRETEVVHIGRDAFPTLAEAIDELYQWWLEHRDDTGLLLIPVVAGERSSRRACVGTTTKPARRILAPLDSLVARSAT